MIIPFTTNKKALRFSKTVELEPTEQNGLDKLSIALVFQLRAIDEKRIESKLGEIETPKLEEIEAKIGKMLNL